ncbi:MULTISPECIES: hypothetical protein [unclassified Wolbachia]|nr:MULTISPECIES: hypothetical protein [unclassified Wolbachia]MDX5507997.1 hypothetical protein [Wolbachia endosymbiont of Hylaeus sinuatus]RLT59828.1 hypothetical protein WANA31_0867 [Wolbachia endosymbiont of Drosophila ananassae]RLT62368.1 hypothetical protein WANA13_0468 [Wolbachia endosymbiont of Drosophila ananassae]RLT62896.1 hypothetical protein WANA34_0919 [Wolbachia endosymbiont of Drosophila ananassae]
MLAPRRYDVSLATYSFVIPVLLFLSSQCLDYLDPENLASSQVGCK